MNLKQSFYSILFQDDNCFIIYNSITDNFILFDKADETLVRSILDSPNTTSASQKETNAKEVLVKNGVLLPEDTDELTLIEEKMHSFSNSEKLILTIALTTNCNLRCVYCFENHEGINDRTFDTKVLAFISDKIVGKKELIIDWYGGEPLLKLKQLLFLNTAIAEIAKINDCHYTSSISTNGYLLDKETTHQLRDSGHIQSMRICVDGPPEIHDKYRPCANGSSSFHTIMENTIYASNYFKIKLRINVDKNNVGYIDDLLEIVDTKPFNRDNLSFAIKPIISARIRPNDASYTIDEFAMVEPRLKSELIKRNVNLEIAKVNQKCTFCVVYHKNQYMMDWRGFLYKCSDTFDVSEAVGKISAKGKIELDKEKIDKWLVFPGKAYDMCRPCKALPLCMGGCTFKRFVSNEIPCSSVKYNMLDYVKLYYEEKKKKVTLPIAYIAHSTPSCDN